MIPEITSYKILPAEIADFRALMDLEQICFSKSDMWSFLDYVGVLSFPDIIKLKAIADEKMIGFIAIDEKNFSTLAQVMTLAVHPDYRKQGIASDLLHQAESKIRKSDRIELIARVDNQAAVKLYKKFGYEEKNIISNYYRDRVAGLRMMKYFPKKN